MERAKPGALGQSAGRGMRVGRSVRVMSGESAAEGVTARAAKDDRWVERGECVTSWATEDDVIAILTGYLVWVVAATEVVATVHAVEADDHPRQHKPVDLAAQRICLRAAGMRGGEELGIHEQIAQAERAIRRQGAEDLREEGAGGGHIHWSRGRGEAGRLGEGDAKRVGGQTGLGAEGGEAQSKGDEE